MASTNDKITLLEDKYEAWTDVGTLSKIDSDKLTITMNSADMSASDYVIKDKNNQDANVDMTFSDLDQDYSALLGQKVKVLFKNGKTNDVIGVYATDDNNVLINTTASKLDTVSGETKIKVDGTKYSVDTTNGLQIWTIKVENGEGKLDKTSMTGKKTAADIKSAIEAINDNDMPVTVISNDNDSKVDVILVNQKSFVKLTTVNSSTVSYKTVLGNMKGDVTGSAVKLDLGNDTPELYKGYAKDDYAFVGADLYNENLVFTKAETVAGKCDSFKDDSIKINGTWYDYVLGIESGTKKYAYTAKAGKSYTAYVYGGYAYYLSGEAGSNSDVDTLLVKTVGDYKTMDEGFETKVYFADGKEQVINVTKVVTPNDKFDLEDWDKDTSSSAWTTKELTKDDRNSITDDTLYAYEQDGSDYILVVLNDNFKSGDVTVLKKNSAVSYNDKSETINGMEAETGAPIYMLYKSNNKYTYKIIAGSSLKNYKAMTGTTNSIVLADKDNVVAAYFKLADNDKLSTSDTLYGVVKKSYKATESNGTDSVIYLDLITSEGAKTVETEETGSAAKYTKGMIVSFTGSYEKANDDIVVESSKQVNGSTESQGYIAIDNNWSDSSKLIRPYTNLFLNGATKTNVAAAKVVSDSTVIYVDEDGYEVSTETPSKAEELDNGVGYYANAYVIVNKDNEIDLLVYEANNRIKDNNNKEVTLTKNVTASATLDAGTTDAQLKNLADGMYIPSGKAFADDVAGNAADNIIFKFTGKGTYTLKIQNSESKAEVYSETSSNLTSSGGHYFYITTKATDSAQNAGTGTYKKAAFVAGNYTFSITDASSNVVLSGSFTIA